MNKEDYQWFKKRHICARCQKARAFGNFIYCAECNYIQNEKHRKWQAENPEKVKQACKKRYDRLKREGKCVRCGRVNPDAGKQAQCPWCRAKLRERARARHVSKAPGLCRYCEQPAVPGKKTCAEHLAQRRAVFLQNQFKRGEKHGTADGQP